ncbi:ATP-binding cassette domain-containing protein, partial [Streptomyces erythrogriseus]|uniref:ATP-binding cassette domain-containing protein n=1 Tax=Streptomyces erythrogriseus TaxID=284027 RepID=UPI003D15B897
MAKTENALVELKNVCYEYPDATSKALINVSISMPKRSLITIIGSNGSGKSTLAQILRGVRKPQEGTIAWASS